MKYAFYLVSRTWCLNDHCLSIKWIKMHKKSADQTTSILWRISSDRTHHIILVSWLNHIYFMLYISWLELDSPTYNYISILSLVLYFSPSFPQKTKTKKKMIQGLELGCRSRRGKVSSKPTRPLWIAKCVHPYYPQHVQCIYFNLKLARLDVQRGTLH